jgi:hypothetical protein
MRGSSPLGAGGLVRELAQRTVGPLEEIRGPHRPVSHRLHASHLRVKRTDTSLKISFPRAASLQLLWAVPVRKGVAVLVSAFPCLHPEKFPACDAGNFVEKPPNFSALNSVKRVAFGSAREFSLHFPA